LSLLLLEFSGYIPNAIEQPKSALLGLKIVIGPVSAILLAAGIIFAIFYPLSREKYAHVVTELKKRQEEKRLNRQNS
jgi:GPH family glycoside/pentoside/hexuronide:cation symporter